MRTRSEPALGFRVWVRQLCSGAREARSRTGLPRQTLNLNGGERAKEEHAYLKKYHLGIHNHYTRAKTLILVGAVSSKFVLLDEI